MNNIPIKDTQLTLPDFTIVSASAGSGKTHELTLRYLQLLLSQNIPHNGLRNILAITFTNNAATEMKQRILHYLKALCLGQEEIVKEVSLVLSLDQGSLMKRAETILSHILDHYSGFQVTTIDSFIISVFKATALEYGYHPDVEILLNNDRLIETAFEEFSRDLKAQREYDELLRKMTALIEQSRGGNRSYIWDPYRVLLREIKRLYRTLRMIVRPLDTQDYSDQLFRISEAIARHAQQFYSLIEGSGLTINKNFKNDLEDIQRKNIDVVLGRTEKDNPINKPKTKDQQKALERLEGTLEAERKTFYELLSRYALIRSRNHYFPYVRVLMLLEQQLTFLAKREGQLSLDDVHRLLKDNFTQELVPEIYFKLGEKIHHYLVDEFQDTSPIHWHNLKPLFEETLSADGSLFIVGDTKQSIYGFRGADWRIMRRLENGKEFASVKPSIYELGTNFRSTEAIVRFNENVFHKWIPASEYSQAADQSGLSNLQQDVKNNKKNKGYVKVTFVQENGETQPDKEQLMRAIYDCLARGYQYGDIGILTPANADVVNISSWLNEHSIPFISHSNLDVRKRKPIGEILALLKFLDSPVDNLSFATFLLSEVFTRAMQHEGFQSSPDELRNFLFESRINNRPKSPLYKLFENKYPYFWKKVFEELFASVGYSPLYDLVSEACKIFNVYGCLPEEEAAFTKLLEVVHQFEQKGNNNLKDFLAFAADETGSDEWNITPPSNANAVTVMTIHKAKGLGFPIVIVLLPDKDVKVDNQILDVGERNAQLLYIIQKLREKNAELQEVYNRQLLLEQTDALNKLYVAFTRAKEEMYIIVVHNQELKGPAKVLSDAEYGAPAEHKGAEDNLVKQAIAELYHHTRRNKQPVVETKRTDFHEANRGTFIHEVLARLEFMGGDIDTKLQETVKYVENAMRSHCDLDEIQRTLSDFLCDIEVSTYFKPEKNRQIWTEQEFVNASGELYRCDRVLIDNDACTVIDFKTGSQESEESYRRQIRNYMNIMKEIFPQKDVHGIITYVDLKQFVSVS